MSMEPPAATLSRANSLRVRVSEGQWLPYAALAALAVVIFGIRIIAPPNLLDQDQERPASYVLDVVKNGNWVCQRDWSGDVTSKPRCLRG
jgi:hypothetical protein